MKEFKIGIGIGIICLIFFGSATAFGAEPEPVAITDEVQFWSEYFGGKYGISPELIEAMAWHESRCVSSAQSDDKRCKGVMQVNPHFHQERMERLKARNVFDIGQNIHIGTDYLAELLNEECGNVPAALARYNGQSAEKVEKARNGEYGGYITVILKTEQELKEGGK